MDHYTAGLLRLRSLIEETSPSTGQYRVRIWASGQVFQDLDFTSEGAALDLQVKVVAALTEDHFVATRYEEAAAIEAGRPSLQPWFVHSPGETPADGPFVVEAFRC